VNRGRQLLAGIVDYAGLFPPSALPMDDAVAEYARQRDGEAAWMLAGLVVPAGRLDELQASRDSIGAPGLWSLSVLLGPDPLADLERVQDFVDRHPGRYEVVALEFRPADAEAVAAVTEAVGGAVEVFCELPWNEDPAPWMPVLRDSGARAKIRTGGVSRDLFPPIEAVARFLRVCADAGVGLKFTAGLHHPVRSEQALTYEPDAPRGTMHGFLNVFVASALLAREPVDDATLHALLAEEDPAAFALEPDGGVRWRDHHLGPEDVAQARRRFARSFGSCSFSEPVTDLQTLDLT